MNTVTSVIAVSNTVITVHTMTTFTLLLVQTTLDRGRQQTLQILISPTKR